MNTVADIFILICIFIIGLLYGMHIQSNFSEDYSITRAISLDYAHYHPKSSVIVWDDEDVKYIIYGTDSPKN